MRLDRWHFNQFISKTWESVAAGDWEAALSQYCGLLDDYLTVRYPNNVETGDSWSVNWLVGVEHDDDDDEASLLLSTIRKIAERTLSNDASTLPKILAILEAQKWDVFQRIIFHILRLSVSDSVSDEVKSRLMVADNFRNPNFFHEYRLLLSTVFDRLCENQRSTILTWIDTFAPSVEEVKDRAKRWNGKEISSEEAEWYIREGKLRWLEPLKNTLPNDWKLKYEEWNEHFGGVSYDYSPRVHAMWVGEPPIPEILVKLLSPERIFQYLKDDLTHQESPRELAKELSHLISERPEQFITLWEEVKELDLTYIQAFFSGIGGKTQEIDAAYWAPLLSAMKWALGRPDANEPEASGLSSVIGDITSSSLPYEDVRIPFSLRFEVWSILQLLLENPNPTVEHERHYGGNNMDPLTFSLNTVRGKAFHTLFKYINWCRRALEVQERTLQSTAEVIPILEKHLDPDVEPSLAVRAVYGERLPALVAFDPDWVIAHLSEIFPTRENLSRLYRATWDTFIIWTRPFNDVFNLLREEYGRAIENLHQDSLYRSESSVKNLSEHLIVFYSRQQIEYEDDLLQRFYELATDGQAAHIFWFIARILRENDLPPQVLERFQRLIEDRVTHGTREERVGFGWLFTCGKFESDWSLRMLREAVSRTKSIDDDNSVVEQLVEMSKTFPKLTIETTIHIVDGADAEWKLQYWSNHLRLIITAAIIGNEKKLASLLVNKLAAKNLPEFRELLQWGS